MLVVTEATARAEVARQFGRLQSAHSEEGRSNALSQLAAAQRVLRAVVKFGKAVSFVYPNGDAATLTAPQRIALENVAERWNLTDTVEVSPMFGGDGAVIVNVGTMWLAVESDGYMHS